MGRVLVLGLALLGLSCSRAEEPPPFPYTFTVTVTSNGRPLEGVTVLYDEIVAGVTNADGLLTTHLYGPEGQPVFFSVRCPEGYVTPQGVQQMVLRRVTSLEPHIQARGVEVRFTCLPGLRESVLIVRTHDQPGLPVYIDETEVARTDAAGAAHVYQRMMPETEFQVWVATASNPNLRPVDPSQSFIVPDYDTVFLFDRRFEEEAPPPRRRRRRRRVRPRGPVR